jgi:CheY-like chemotaxis protein
LGSRADPLERGDAILADRKRGSPVVLVVDDDPDVLDVTAGVLELKGFAVLRASSGQEAIEALRRHPEVELLFTDVLMPGITGIELAKQATAMRPGLPVVLTSGYARDENVRGYPLVRKPFTLHDLLHTVEAHFGRRPEPA